MSSLLTGWSARVTATRPSNPPSPATSSQLEISLEPPYKDTLRPLLLSATDFFSGLSHSAPFSDWPTIPQVYLSGEFVGGCDILLAMHSSGELETLLVKEGVIPEDLPTPAAEEAAPKKD